MADRPLDRWVSYAVVFFGTLATRAVKHIYVANWFFAAFIITVAVLHIVNNSATPADRRRAMRHACLHPGSQRAERDCAAHADSNELLGWLKQAPERPKRVFITHGEPAASDALRRRIEHELGWDAVVPTYRNAF